MWIQGQDCHGNFAYRPSTAIFGVVFTVLVVAGVLLKFWYLAVAGAAWAGLVYWRSGKTPAAKFRERFPAEVK